MLEISPYVIAILLPVSSASSSTPINDLCCPFSTTYQDVHRQHVDPPHSASQSIPTLSPDFLHDIIGFEYTSNGISDQLADRLRPV